MDTEEALRALGVRDDTLSADEKVALDRAGFLPLYGILSPDQIAAINARLAALLDQEGANAGKEVRDTLHGSKPGSFLGHPPSHSLSTGLCRGSYAEPAEAGYDTCAAHALPVLRTRSLAGVTGNGYVGNVHVRQRLRTASLPVGLWFMVAVERLFAV